MSVNIHFSAAACMNIRARAITFFLILLLINTAFAMQVKMTAHHYDPRIKKIVPRPLGEITYAVSILINNDNLVQSCVLQAPPADSQGIADGACGSENAQFTPCPAGSAAAYLHTIGNTPFGSGMAIHLQEPGSSFCDINHLEEGASLQPAAACASAVQVTESACRMGLDSGNRLAIRYPHVTAAGQPDAVLLQPGCEPVPCPSLIPPQSHPCHSIPYDTSSTYNDNDAVQALENSIRRLGEDSPEPEAELETDFEPVHEPEPVDLVADIFQWLNNRLGNRDWFACAQRVYHPFISPNMIFRVLSFRYIYRELSGRQRGRLVLTAHVALLPESTGDNDHSGLSGVLHTLIHFYFDGQYTLHQVVIPSLGLVFMNQEHLGSHLRRIRSCQQTGCPPPPPPPPPGAGMAAIQPCRLEGGSCHQTGVGQLEPAATFSLQPEQNMNWNFLQNLLLPHLFQQPLARILMLNKME